jgi:hypothetical protein
MAMNIDEGIIHPGDRETSATATNRDLNLRTFVAIAGGRRDRRDRADADHAGHTNVVRLRSWHSGMSASCNCAAKSWPRDHRT